MPTTRTIKAFIDLPKNRVTFRSAHPNVPRDMTFAAGLGDTLVWELSGGEGLTAFVTFVPPPSSPLVGGQVLKSNGNTITGTLKADARLGDHHYQFDVEGPGLPRTKLECFWENVPTEMGGGVITDPPPALSTDP